MATKLIDVDFTIAICTLNRRSYLEKAVSECLTQINEFPNGKVLVIDNGSTDTTIAYLEELK